jgi:hypothetical protein
MLDHYPHDAAVFVGNLPIRLTDLQLLHEVKFAFRSYGECEVMVNRTSIVIGYGRLVLIYENNCKIATLRHLHHGTVKVCHRSNGTNKCNLAMACNGNCIDMQVERMWRFLLALAGRPPYFTANLSS